MPRASGGLFYIAPVKKDAGYGQSCDCHDFVGQTLRIRLRSFIKELNFRQALYTLLHDYFFGPNFGGFLFTVVAELPAVSTFFSVVDC